MEPGLQLELEPRWEELPALRKKTAEFLGKKQLSRDVVDAVTMVTCELTENATKYGAFENGVRHIAVRVTVHPNEVSVEVAQPVDPKDSDNLNQLDRMVQWIRGYQDPFEAYLQRLKDLSTEGFDSTESRLGLVRIAYEGQSVIDFYVNEQHVLSVSAIRRLV